MAPQASVMACGRTQGAATATPKYSANHTNTQRAIPLGWRRVCKMDMGTDYGRAPVASRVFIAILTLVKDVVCGTSA